MPTKIGIDKDSPAFESADEAAHALSEKFGAIKGRGKEVAGVLFKTPEGKYQYSTGVSGSNDDFALAAQVPKGYALAGIVHTHPGDEDQSQVFSPHDVDIANQLKLPSYVRFLRDGSTRRYQPGVSPTQLIPVAGMLGQQHVAQGEALQLPTAQPTPPSQDPAPAASTNTPQSVNVSGNQLDTTSAPAGLDLSNLLGGLLSGAGAGISASNQQQAYNGLQSALNTIGPTSLNGFTLGGPGGMSSGYNPSAGTAGIDLGSLNPAFGNLSSAAGAGSGNYNPGLLSALTGNAAGTLGMSTGALGSAYGNYGAGMGAAGTQLNNLGDFNTNYNNLLQGFRGQSAPGIQQQAYGLQNTLFGNGTLDSTGATSGSIASQNFGRGVAQADSTNQLNAFNAALNQQNSAATNYGTLSNSASGMLSSALNNFGNTNQLISGLNTAQLNNSLQAVQGAGALNTLGLNGLNSALQVGSAQSTARNQSLFPYASVATALSGTQNGGNIFASLLSGAGGSMMGANGGNGVTGLLSQLLKGSTGNNGILGNLFGTNGSALSGSIGGLTSGSGDYLSGQLGSAPVLDTAGQNATDFSQLFGDSFNGAGGQAAGDAATSQTYSTPSQIGGWAADAGGAAAAAPAVASAFGGAAAPAGAVTISDLAGNVLAGGAADAAATGGAAAGASAGASAGAAGGTAGTAAGAGALGTAAAGAGAAALFALPIMGAFGMLPDDTVPTGAAFVHSIQGSPYFSSAEQKQINQAYGQVGEAGFPSWFAKNFPAFAGAAGGARAQRAAVRQI